ncbi:MULTISPECIES: hypothetical protein [unclassified Thioalkalivibrio]|uniref:hypothetical protein n=1 Tax=unclassified Thioalkalivibrio TaxID=2621013 RepID=UPI000370AA76|nr:MULTISPECIES: hypothetical protein [unclassified Thioalkalivibrio]
MDKDARKIQWPEPWLPPINLLNAPRQPGMEANYRDRHTTAIEAARARGRRSQ